MPSMLFVLTGRDDLSGTLDRAGDHARRLARRLDDTSRSGSTSVARFTTDAQGRLRDLQGRFISVADAQRLMADGTPLVGRRVHGMADAADKGSRSLGELKKAAVLLAPAAIPAAASLAPIAATALTVGAALGVMGAAIAPQVAALVEVAGAEKKWRDAVDASGAASQQAVAAQTEYQRAVAKLPPETRKAAAALSALKDAGKSWSDSLSGDTMPAFTKGLGIANALLPKTAGLARAAGTETDRFMTIIGGEMASPGLDRLDAKFTTFADRTLRHLNDELVRTLRTGSTGDFGGDAKEFMAWAREQGPTVGHVLQSVAQALMHVLQAGSDVGVGLLDVVDVLADIVAAVPPGAVSTLLQLALAIRMVRAAALGLAAGRSVLVAFIAQVMTMQTAAAAAPGPLRAMTAALGSLSRGAKLALVGSGIGLLILALTQLSAMGKKTPPDVDRLTTSLGELARTGKVSGEAARAFGGDLGGLADSLRTLSRPSNLDKTQQFLTSLIGMDSTPVKEAKEDLDGVDKALAGLVQSGKADLAEAAFDRIAAAMRKQGMSTGELRHELDDYKSSLADQRFEQELTAASMGVFGQQAQAVQAKLAGQKQSADGLRQSLQALNDVQRAGLGGMIGFEASIDAAAKAAKDNAGSLRMVHGELDLNSEKARSAATALNDLASKTDEATAQARESGASWETVNGIYSRGRAKLIESAHAMGLTKTQAAQLADQILKIPDKTARVHMRAEDATADLDRFIGKVKASPGSKSVTLKTLSASAQQVLESFGYRVTHLKDGSVRVTAITGTALSNLYAVQRARNALADKSITITTNRVTRFTSVQGGVTVAKRDYAGGGRVRGYAGGGDVQFFPEGGYISGPGTGTSDSIWAMFASGARARVSNTEYVVRSAAVSKYGVAFLDALNAGRLDPALVKEAGFAGGGALGAGSEAARGLAQGLTGSTGAVDTAARVMAAAVITGIKTELEIASPSKKTKALAADIGKGLIIGMTGTRDKIKATAKDLAADIRTAFSCKKESRLLAMVDRDTKKLLDLASKRDKIAAKIAEAKQYASSTTSTARQAAGLSNLGMDAEHITAGGIKAGLAKKLADIRQFSRYISILAKRGLSKGLLRQILDMGPVDGYAYASALVGADKSTFAAINKSQKAIDAETTRLGRKGADALYDSGKNAGKGFLKGLESQEDELKKLMEKLAKSMQSALRKALGIKSPARKLIPDGINTARGVAVGVLAGLPYVDQAMNTMAGRMVGRASITPSAGRAVSVSRGGTQQVNIQVDVNGVTDPVAVARELQRTLLGLKRHHGLNVSLGVG